MTEPLALPMMAVLNGHFYAVEPNHDESIRVNPGGHA